ncbi:MAG TPA: beta-ketoacyl-ACP reductase [Chloroflexota bacterium]|nr:beta-ketoacyl-ACP reductase [Chloroflexota bacterium]
MDRLKDRVAFITGASRGIGRATAERLAQEGAKVCLADIDAEGVRTAAQALEDQGLEASALPVDVTSREQVEAAIGETAQRYGRLDILVNNAGVIRDNMLFRMSDEDWQTVMSVHLTGAFLCSRAAQAIMVKQGYGRIVNLSSTSALGNRGQTNYAAAKAGLQGFTKTLAIELGKFGITCNAVAPGFIETEMTHATAARMGVPFERFAEEASRMIPAGRIGTPADVAAAILFFASEEAGYVNGQVLYVAGGPKD